MMRKRAGKAAAGCLMLVPMLAGASAARAEANPVAEELRQLREEM